MTQYEIILNSLNSKRQKVRTQMLQRMGIQKPTARISVLRDRGYPIATLEDSRGRFYTLSA